MATVLIRGGGIAGCCCSRLFREAGVDIRVETTGRPNLPAIMLGETTQKLLRDVFNREDLFEGFPEIRRRVVAWGPKGKAKILPHYAVVVSEKELLDRIQPGPAQSREANSEEPDWTIFASRPLPPLSVEYQFGSRPAAAWAVALQRGCDSEACWIESLENGWLFLLPSGRETGCLLSVGDSVESLLAVSRLIREQIANISLSRGIFPSHPRLAYPLSAPGWLACGAAALGFDPLCGDGAGNAVREAILGSAVVRAAIGGGDAGSLVAHYQARLLAGFRRHIGLCFDFYKSGCSGAWWERQLIDLERGVTWCSEQLADSDASRYRLNGFTLELVK
jgi:flavin-dependent dehydrogenase